MTTTQEMFPTELHFRVSPRTMQMLGRDNISSPTVGVLELVKNAYDADAKRVSIVFHQASTDAGEIIITDTGEGMDLSDLRDKWMTISTDDKLRHPMTKTGRIKVGEKGIGRLAMDRLCKRAIITTWRKGASRAIQLDIDWTKYEQDSGEIHEITHPLKRVDIPSEEPSGTILHLKELRDRWGREDYEKLHSSLAFLVPPFDDNLVDFAISFECDEAPDLSGSIASAMTDAAEYKLTSTLTVDGTIHHILTHRSSDTIEDTLQWEQGFNDVPPGRKPVCGPLRFVLYFYIRESSSLRGTSVKLQELLKFLNQFQGVRIYRDNFRVHPYGDPGGDKDWLGLNQRKVRHPDAITRPEWVLAESQVVGSIFISRPDNRDLQDKTNREGLIENRAYRDMQRFALHGIQFLERERHNRYIREVPVIKETEPVGVDEAFTDIQTKLTAVASELRQTASKIPEGSLFESSETKQLREELPERIEQLTAQVQRLYAEQQTERQLLLGLSTLGIAMSAFGHETIRAVNSLLVEADFLKEGIEYLPEQYKVVARENLRVLIEAAERIEEWGKFALNRIRRDKRTKKLIKVGAVITELLETFSGVVHDQKINVVTDLSPNIPDTFAFPMDIEAILINFFTNAIEAMRYTSLDKRCIKIETAYDEATLEFVLKFTDGGKGIRLSDVNKIYDPLFSTKTDSTGKPIGTGMGLTIVRDIVANNYQGRIKVEGMSALGGAEFTVIIPNRPKKGSRNGRN